MIKRYLRIVLLLPGLYAFGQKRAAILPDTIRGMDYDTLFEKIEATQGDSLAQSVYLKGFLGKARGEQNWEELVNGYKNYFHYTHSNLRLTYADSMILTAKASGDKALIGSAYLTKGVAYYGEKRHNEALDYYLQAKEYTDQTGDVYLKLKVKYNIAHVKYYLGAYEEALRLFQECLPFFEKNNTRAYLNTLHSIGLCYNREGNYGLCSETNALGLKEGERLGNRDMEPYFIHSEGVNQYFRHNYTLAIQKIEASLPGIRQNDDFANETVGYFYIGKSHWALDRIARALPYLRKVDESFQQRNYMRPDLREAYEMILQYYKEKGNPEARLHYIEKLLKVDSLLNTTHRYLSDKIHKEYDTKGLVQEKARIQKQLLDKRRNTLILIGVIVVLFLFLLFMVYRYFRNKKIFRQKFEELMNRKNGGRVISMNGRPKGLDINPDAVTTVLKQLELFEKDQKFLENDITLVKLAAAFNSNTKYLSRIIFHYKGKRFVEYINELKIDYIIEQLKTDRHFRNYANWGLAEAAGFSSTQRFVNAFVSRTGISPTYFVTKLREGY